MVGREFSMLHLDLFRKLPNGRDHRGSFGGEWHSRSAPLLRVCTFPSFLRFNNERQMANTCRDPLFQVLYDVEALSPILPETFLDEPEIFFYIFYPFGATLNRRHFQGRARNALEGEQVEIRAKH